MLKLSDYVSKKRILSWDSLSNNWSLGELCGLSEKLSECIGKGFSQYAIIELGEGNFQVKKTNDIRAKDDNVVVGSCN